MSAIASGNLQSVKEKGWRRGLGNLLQGEYSAWFKSSRWWKHLILWFPIINVMMMIMVIASAQEAKKGNEGKEQADLRFAQTELVQKEDKDGAKEGELDKDCIGRG